jgi:hypothetical protein
MIKTNTFNRLLIGGAIGINVLIAIKFNKVCHMIFSLIFWAGSALPRKVYVLHHLPRVHL